MMSGKSTGKDVLVLNIGIIFGLLMLVGVIGFGFVLFSYQQPSYITVEYDYTDEVVGLDPGYLQSTDLISFLEVFALILIALSIAFSGLLHYVKEQ